MATHGDSDMVIKRNLLNTRRNRLLIAALVLLLTWAIPRSASLQYLETSFGEPPFGSGPFGGAVPIPYIKAVDAHKRYETTDAAVLRYNTQADSVGRYKTTIEVKK